MQTRFVATRGILAAWGLLVVAIAPLPARAGVDIAFGAAVQIDDDTDVYLAISTQYFDREREEIHRWNRQCDNPDDLAVALFISRHSGKNPDDIIAMHEGGLAWWEVSVRLGVKPDVWFVPVKREPGPPFGKAYGHRKMHGRYQPRELSLTDDDLRNLVAVRLLHDYYGVSVEAAMEWRSSGRGLREITAGEYRKRHGKGRGDAVKASAGVGSGNALISGGESSDNGRGKSKTKKKK
jgi:hypothetical protein